MRPLVPATSGQRTLGS